jgi:hypothetical protein
VSDGDGDGNFKHQNSNFSQTPNTDGQFVEMGGEGTRPYLGLEAWSFFDV